MALAGTEAKQRPTTDREEQLRWQYRKRLCELKKLLLYAGPDPDVQFRKFHALTRVLGYEVRAPHAELIRFQNITRYGGVRQQDLVLGYRGLGKSTVGTIASAIMDVIENPDVRIGFFSDTAGAAQEILKEVHGHLRYNRLLTEMFGDFFLDNATSRFGRYREGYATILQRADRTVREPTFTCIGIGGQAASRHFDVVYGDDLVTLEKSRTETQRKYLRDWFGSTFIGTFMAHTRVHYRGTRYYPHDLWEDLEEGRDDEVTGPLAGATLRLPLVYIDPETGIWSSLDPEKYTTEQAKARAAQMGRYHFFSQMQQDVKSGEGMVFSYPDFRWYSDKENAPPSRSKMRVFQFSDLAAKKTDTGDFFVLTTIGVADVNGEKRVWVLDMVRERAGMRRQRELILSEAAKWKPFLAGVEAVAMQAGFAEEIHDMTLLPVVPVQVEKDKVFRARRVSHLVDSHKVYFQFPDTPAGKRTKVLIDELTTFPDAEHDDCVDSFVGALTLAVFGGPKAASPALDDMDFDEDAGLLADY